RSRIPSRSSQFTATCARSLRLKGVPEEMSAGQEVAARRQLERAVPGAGQASDVNKHGFNRVRTFFSCKRAGFDLRIVRNRDPNSVAVDQRPLRCEPTLE